MKRFGWMVMFMLMFALGMNVCASEAEKEGPHLVEASIVTEVLEWGETVTALRLEYSEEIPAISVPQNMQYPGTVTYMLANDRDIVSVYVNNSGKKDDVQVKGKYVFLNLGLESENYFSYTSYVTFNPTAKRREQLPEFQFYQVNDIETCSGAIIPASAPVGDHTCFVSTTNEICIGTDDFTYFDYEDLGYLLYIPEGYDDKDANLEDLPLVVHFSAGDYGYSDWTGKYRGALFTHPDCVVWGMPENQEKNPSFVVTLACASDPEGGWGTMDFASSPFQQKYFGIIEKIIADYNVDTSRVYAVGLASGTKPMLSMMEAHMDLFAAQMSTAYDPYTIYKDREVAAEKMAMFFEEMPCWWFTGYEDNSRTAAEGIDTWLKGERLAICAADIQEKYGIPVYDGYGEEGELMWNGQLRGAAADGLALKQIAEAEAMGADDMMTSFIPGSVCYAAHWGWNGAYTNAAVLDWMYAQVNDTPYVLSE